jgi:valyl-tRNA synthetase
VALGIVLRLLAPVLPFVTEEVWSWWREGSVHRATWPSASELEGALGDPAVVAEVAVALSAIRKAKSDAKVSMRADVATAVVTGDSDVLGRVEEVARDLAAAGRVAQLTFVPSGGPLAVEVTLAETPSASD